MSPRRRRAKEQTGRARAVRGKVLRRRARGAAARRAAAAALAVLVTVVGGRAPAGATDPGSRAEPVGASAGGVAALAGPRCAGPLTPPSSPQQLTAVEGASFFTANDGTHGRELWRSDGTRAGTVLVKDLRPGAGSSRPSSLTVVKGTLFFTADNGTHGRELWKSDGTGEGTVLVKNIRPGAGASTPSSLTRVRRTLFFGADDGTHGAELWKSDGTRAGTVLVKDIAPGASGSHDYPDGHRREMTRARGTLFFGADDGTHGNELWKSDGTRAGTVLVKDVNPGRSDSNVLYSRQMTVVGERLFFTATDATHGFELWKTDGTEAGTVLIKDQPDDEYYELNPWDLTNVDGTLFFTVGGGLYNRGQDDLWKSDGTQAGTVLVKNMDNYNYAYPEELTAAGGSLFFSASTNYGGNQELWTSNGTTAGTVIVKDIKPGEDASSRPTRLTSMGERLFFTAEDDPHGRELWRSDGTTAGTVLIKDVHPGAGSSNASSLTAARGTLFFSADDGTHGAELWKSDGTRAGTVLVKDINTGESCSSTPQDQRTAGGDGRSTGSRLRGG